MCDEKVALRRKKPALGENQTLDFWFTGVLRTNATTACSVVFTGI